MKTAVEWLAEQIECFGNKHELQMSWATLDELIEQAKEMEREQIKDAWDKRGDRIVPKYFLKENINGEQYYNETFKQEIEKL